MKKISIIFLVAILMTLGNGCATCTTSSKTYYSNGQIQSDYESNGWSCGETVMKVVTFPFALIESAFIPSCHCHLHWQNNPPPKYVPHF